MDGKSAAPAGANAPQMRSVLADFFVARDRSGAMSAAATAAHTLTGRVKRCSSHGTLLTGILSKLCIAGFELLTVND